MARVVAPWGSGSCSEFVGVPLGGGQAQQGAQFDKSLAEQQAARAQQGTQEGARLQLAKDQLDQTGKQLGLSLAQTK